MNKVNPKVIFAVLDEYRRAQRLAALAAAERVSTAWAYRMSRLTVRW